MNPTWPFRFLFSEAVGAALARKGMHEPHVVHVSEPLQTLYVEYDATDIVVTLYATVCRTCMSMRMYLRQSYR